MALDVQYVWKGTRKASLLMKMLCGCPDWVSLPITSRIGGIGNPCDLEMLREGWEEAAFGVVEMAYENVDLCSPEVMVFDRWP